MAGLNAKQAALIPRIYDAASSQELWSSALDAVAEGADAKGCVLFALDTVGLPFSIHRFSGIYSGHDVEYYREHLLHYEAEGWDAVRAAPLRTFVLDQDLGWDLEALRSRPDYVFLREAVDVLRRGAARLNDSPGWIDSVALQFDPSMEHVPVALIRQAEAMLPHLAKAVELGRSFAILQHRYQAILSALDHVRIGVCVTSHHGSVIVANKEAKRIFDLGDGLTVAKDARFHCQDQDVSAQVDAAINAAIQTIKGEGDAAESIIAVPRRSGRHPFLIEVAPLSDSAGELERQLKGAVVFIVDPENPRPFAIETVAKLFALTPAECEVCALMVQGLTDAEIAMRRAVSVETVRTQIKAVYRKTDTSRRAELIRLTLSITPPIDAP